jgi:hypothetical protein
MAITSEYKGHSIAVQNDGTFEVTAYGKIFGTEKEARGFLDQHVADEAKKSLGLMDIIKGTNHHMLVAAKISSDMQKAGQHDYVKRTGVKGNYKYEYANGSSHSDAAGKRQMSHAYHKQEITRQGAATGEHGHGVRVVPHANYEQNNKHVVEFTHRGQRTTSETPMSLKDAQNHAADALTTATERASDPKAWDHVAADTKPEGGGSLQVGEKPARPLRGHSAMGYLGQLREKHGDGTAAEVDAQIEAVKDGWVSGGAIIGSGYKNPKKSALGHLAEKKAKLASKSMDGGFDLLKAKAKAFVFDGGLSSKGAMFSLDPADDKNKKKIKKMGMGASPMAVAMSKDPADDDESPTGRGSKTFGLKYSKKIKKQYGMDE